MIKLKVVESESDYRLLLRFSEGPSGVFDVAPFIEDRKGDRGNYFNPIPSVPFNCQPPLIAKSTPS